VSTRWEVERALFASDLSAQQRLLVLTLLSMADSKTAVVPAEHTPSLSRLAGMTKLAKSTVAKELNTLEASGWVDRLRPSIEAARSKKERTRYRLTVPPTSPPHGLELVRTTDQTNPPTGPSHGPELVRGADQSWSVPRTRASPWHGHKLDLEPSSSSSSNGTTVLTRISEALSVEEEEADRIFKRILAERRPGAPSRYVDHLIASGDISQFHTAAKPASTYAGPRCQYVDPGDGTGYCATCSMPAAHARHGGQP
jgi:hypothetical protein